MEGFLGQIICFGGNFAPRSWAFCDGQLLAISQYSALFSILGTTYGGDGRTTFGLPDLRGRAAVNRGNGPGLSSYKLGQKAGQETVSLTTLQIPSHNHLMNVRREPGNSFNPKDNTLASNAEAQVYTTAADDATLKNTSITNTGGGQPHNNIQPYLAINWIIAIQGTFPSRS